MARTSTRVFVLEVNPRSSRTVPFLSKATGVPMVKLATNIMLGKSLEEQGYKGGLWHDTMKLEIPGLWQMSWYDVSVGPNIAMFNHVQKTAPRAIADQQWMIIAPVGHCGFTRATENTVVGERTQPLRFRGGAASSAFPIRARTGRPPVSPRRLCESAATEATMLAMKQWQRCNSKANQLARPRAMRIV